MGVPGNSARILAAALPRRTRSVESRYWLGYFQIGCGYETTIERSVISGHSAAGLDPVEIAAVEQLLSRCSSCALMAARRLAANQGVPVGI
jgi:hypothetical protein